MDLVKNLKSGYFQIRFQPLLISLSWWKVDDRNQHIRLYFESKFRQNWIICWFFIDFLNRPVDQLPTPSMRCRYEQKLFFFSKIAPLSLHVVPGSSVISALLNRTNKKFKCYNKEATPLSWRSRIFGCYLDRWHHQRPEGPGSAGRPSSETGRRWQLSADSRPVPRPSSACPFMDTGPSLHQTYDSLAASDEHVGIFRRNLIPFVKRSWKFKLEIFKFFRMASGKL